LWFAILNGLLAGLAAGRSWNEQGGSILDVQEIGRAIWDRSVPFLGCDSEPIPLPTAGGHPGGSGGGYWLESEDEGMPCIDLSHMIDISRGDGHLWVLNGCCEWVDMGVFGGATEELITDPPGEQTDPETPFSACGKAKAILDAIYTVAQAMWGATNSDPWDMVNDVKSASFPMSIKAKYALEGIFMASNLKALGYEEESVFDELTRQAILCRLARTLAADTGALSQDNINSINDAFNQNMEFETALFNAAGNALGLSQLSNISMVGQLNQTADCGCPELVPPTMPPTDGGPYFSGLVLKTAGDGAIAATALSSNMRKIDLRWMVDAPGEQTTALQALVYINSPVNLTSLTVRMTGDYPVADWHSLPFVRYTDPHNPNLDGPANETKTLVSADATGATWLIEWVTPAKPSAIGGDSTHEYRSLPADTREAGLTTTFAFEILDWA